MVVDSHRVRVDARAVEERPGLGAAVTQAPRLPLEHQLGVALGDVPAVRGDLQMVLADAADGEWRLLDGDATRPVGVEDDQMKVGRHAVGALTASSARAVPRSRTPRRR
jgi:hypothetical protein